MTLMLLVSIINNLYIFEINILFLAVEWSDIIVLLIYKNKIKLYFSDSDSNNNNNSNNDLSLEINPQV